jgi:hypothetical protein
MQFHMEGESGQVQCNAAVSPELRENALHGVLSTYTPELSTALKLRTQVHLKEAMLIGGITAQPKAFSSLPLPRKSVPAHRAGTLLAAKLQSAKEVDSLVLDYTDEEVHRLLGRNGPRGPDPDLIEELLDDVQRMKHYSAFAPRPLPKFNGAIPPNTITGTDADNTVKKPAAGFPVGWGDESVQRVKANTESAAIAKLIRENSERADFVE